MEEKKVMLHGLRGGCPFNNRVEIALKMKGVEYEFFEEDLKNKSPDLLKYNLIHKKIPVLIHGNKGIAESQLILEYIDEAWNSGPSIMPRDPYQRSLTRFWARFIDDKLFQSIMKALWRGEEEAIEEVLENMRILDRELEGKMFFGGESIGFTDIVANFLGYWLTALEEATGKVIVTKERFPSLCKWRDEFEHSEIVKQILPSKEKLVPIYRAHLEATQCHNSK